MPNSIKLTYFNIAGRGQPIRLALEVGNVKYEDNRISFNDWEAVKPSTPYGKLPVLEVDGKVFGQTKAILRYAGKLGGIYPEDPLVALLEDQYLDAIDDLRAPVEASVQAGMAGTDKDTLMATRKTISESHLPMWFDRFESSLASNGTGYLVGDSLGVSDLFLYISLKWFTSGVIDNLSAKESLEARPHLSALYERVKSNEKVAAFEAKHA